MSALAAGWLVVTLWMPTSVEAAGARKAQPPAAAAASATAAATRRSAQLEAANIAELRARMGRQDLSLMRRADMGDAVIEVWLYQPLRQYYVSVSLQGAIRRTLKPVNEAEAWLNFDSFRRLAALGEVGRPVLLGQMGGGGAAPSGEAAPAALAGPVSAPAAMPAATVAATPAVMAGQDLRTVAVPPERLAAQQEVDAMDLELVRQARDQYARTDPSMALAPPVMSRDSSASAPASAAIRATGQAVETLQRRLIGDELARLVWNADSGQYTAMLTRQGKVLGLLRSGDHAEALGGYQDLVRQAEARVAAAAATPH